MRGEGKGEGESERKGLPQPHARHPVLLRLLILLLAAIALNFAFSPFPLRPLSLVALVPLLALIETESPKNAFRYGLFFGAAFYAGHLWWLWTLVVPVTPITRILLNLGVTLLFVYLGLWIALFALAARRIGIWWSPLIWAALEWLRSQSEGGFPWGLLGTSMTPLTPMIQSASFLGVYGISALVVLINLLLYKSVARQRTAPAWVFPALLGLAIAAPLLYGLVRIKPTEQWFRAGIIQPNVSPVEKSKGSTREEIWREMLRLSHAAIAERAELLLYPETSSLTDLSDPSPFRDSLQALADSYRTPIVIGTPLYGPFGYSNGTVAIEPGRPISEFYVKLHPAPFSEHFPFVDKVPFLKRMMTADMGDMAPGHEIKVFDLSMPGDAGSSPLTDTDPGPGARLRLCTPICFEGIFPNLIQQFTHRGADLIAVVTNDGWFGKTPGPYQHCELMVMRAVENGVPFLRAANNGVSLVADPYGRVLNHTDLFITTKLVQDVPRPLPPTWYRRNGDVFARWCVVIMLLLIAVRIVQAIVRRRAREPRA